VRNGVAEIDCIPAGGCSSSASISLRRRLKRGEHSPGAAQVAALHTRQRKDYTVPVNELRERRKDCARQLALLDLRSVVRSIKRRNVARGRPFLSEFGRKTV
jgi:hypothetical protein